jgi:branched-chain amino acid transport system ATP-binding protein
VAEPLLRVEKLVRRFGGIVATDQVSLDVAKGELHAIIGPNGAGKTTLLAELSGDLIPDRGAIRFDGTDISRLGTARRVALGLARSFQITSLFGEFTALDNVALAAQARAGHSFRFWRPAQRDEALRRPARQLLDETGLTARADIPSAALLHGEQRALEIAMVLATRPRCLLLDEPMAGMGIEDAAAIVKLLASLKRRVTIVLVEHDMDAVFALADRISVLVYGRLIATGAPEDIRRDPEVRRAYLGEAG